MSLWRLHYFHIYGKAESIWLFFTLQNVKFEDVWYTSEEWKQFGKGMIGGEFHQLPVLDWIDPNTGQTFKYAQSGTILWYLFNHFKLWPRNIDQEFEAEQIWQYYSDYGDDV